MDMPPESLQDSLRFVRSDADAAPQADHVSAAFALQASRTPGRVAIVAAGGTWTYGDLLARMHAAETCMLRQGLSPESPVAVWMERSPTMVALLLGVMAAGACYLPIDPNEPPQRVRRMLRVAGARLVVGDAALLERLRSSDAAASGDEGLPRLIDVREIESEPGPDSPLQIAPGGHRLAYLMFTSGSSGEPKAVEVEHHSVVHLLHAVQSLLGFGPDDRYLAASTIAFDISVAELFLPLFCGGSLLLRDRSILLEPHRLAADIRTQGVTVFQTGPSVWSLLLDELREFPSLRVAITTGEAIAPALAQRLVPVADQVWNLYGPTETTVWATAQRLDPEAGSARGLSSASAPIGVALGRLCCGVIDAQGGEAPDGEEGELWIGGVGVARGYRGLSAATSERFQEPDGSGRARRYRTGDRVVRGHEGTLHYFGRFDDQIKVRGVRIEPAEVEAALLRDPRIAQAAVTWFEGPQQARAVVAAVVLRQGAVAAPQDLAARLAEQLPAAMIPSRIVAVQALPVTPAGKVDRIAIRHAASHAPPVALAAAGVRSLSTTEQQLTALWARLLDLPQVGPGDHFFSIGGDSLSAVQMMVEVEALFGITLPVQLAFEAPTVEALARRVDRLRARPDDLGNTDFIFPIVASGSGAPLYFSNVDLRLARHGSWTVDCPLYAMANWARGSGFLQARSLQDLAAAHVATLRRLQPTGPYRLAGFSMGGLIVYEMAQQLLAAAEDVELLVLLDAMMPPRSTLPEVALPARDPMMQRLRRRLRRIAGGPGRIGLAAWSRLFLPGWYAPFVQWTAYRLVHLYGRHPNPVSQRLLPKDRWPAFWYAARRMAVAYEAQPYAGRALALVVQEGAAAAAWRGLLRGPAEVRVLGVGDHRNLFAEPALGTWMGVVAKALQRR